MDDQKLQELKDARALGVTEVSRGDERVKYRSLEEMDRIIARAERERAGMSARPRARILTPKMGRGF